MKLAWATDIHLDFVDSLQGEKFKNFVDSMLIESPDAVLLTGDISIADQLFEHLLVLENVFNIPIMYVLGNHDYYGGSIRSVRDAAKNLNQRSKRLRWLGGIEHARLTLDTALVGHDCWYDALNGNWQNSRVILSDWSQIREFEEIKRIPQLVIDKSRSLTKEGALHLEKSLDVVVKKYKNVIIATHVPPFIEACREEGKCTIPDCEPWYTCLSVGRLIFSYADKNPNVNFTVFSGHTHGKGNVRLLPNLEVRVGRSVYGKPLCQDFVTLS